MQVDDNTGTDVYYLNMQAVSYRFESVLCCRIRQQSAHQGWVDWARQRFRNAVLELATIAMRVLARGTLLNFPISL